MPSVVNARNHVRTIRDRYIGRPSSLGNPFTHLEGTIAEFKVDTRSEAISRYEDWLRSKIKEKDPKVLRALKNIKEETVLVCWCKPLPCHGDIIIKIWREMQEGVLEICQE